MYIHQISLTFLLSCTLHMLEIINLILWY